jgi:hypothetical protein
MLKTTLAKLLTVKAAAAAMAVTAAGGGLAFAATSGALPVGASADNGHSQASAHATARPSAAAGKAAAGAAAADADAGHGSAAPSPSLVGLCRAYAAGVHDNPGKALDNPAFGALITAANGKGNVSDYCTDLLKDQPTAGASAEADNRPTARPTTHATPSHPTGPAPSISDNPRVLPTRPAS